MANITPSIAQVFNSYTLRMHTWGPMANGDVGLPVEFGTHADRTVQVGGTFGSGGTIVIEGSMDGSDYQVLNDPFGVSLSFTGPKIRTVTEVTKYVRARVTGGDGTTALNVNLLMRSAS